MELNQRQSHRQTITPQLKQTIDMFSMDAQELSEFLQQMSLGNPVFEVELPNMRAHDRMIGEMRFLSDRAYADDEEPTKEEKDPISFLSGPSEQSLTQFVREQIDIIPLGIPQRRFAISLLERMDENGYIDCDLCEMGEATGLSGDDTSAVLSMLQTLEPAGIFARNLSECLLLQLERMGEHGTASLMARDHLSDLAYDRVRQIAKALGVSREEVIRAKQIIAALSPKPGAEFASKTPPAYAIPDVNVFKTEDGYAADFNADSSVGIRINASYRSILQQEAIDEDTKAFLTNCFEQARWAVRSIDQRKRNILRCANALIRRQMQFFESGPSFEQPLGLQDIADDTGLSVSTVSRCFKGKYLQCRWGVFAFSHFLSAALKLGEGQEVSANRIKSLIAGMIEKEDKKRPLSDEKISLLLKRQGIQAARRTVAKYRQQLNLLPAALRKNV